MRYTIIIRTFVLLRGSKPDTLTNKTDMKPLQIGDTIRAIIFGQTFTGQVTGFGRHKGYDVIDFIDQNGTPKFAYLNQLASE